MLFAKPQNIAKTERYVQLTSNCQMRMVGTPKKCLFIISLTIFIKTIEGSFALLITLSLNFIFLLDFKRYVQSRAARQLAGDDMSLDAKDVIKSPFGSISDCQVYVFFFFFGMS